MINSFTIARHCGLLEFWQRILKMADDDSNFTFCNYSTLAMLTYQGLVPSYYILNVMLGELIDSQSEITACEFG